MTDEHKECAATTKAELEEYIMNPCTAKNEAEWWASREIERLREALNEQIVSQQQLRGLIAQYSQRYVRMQEALKPFAYYADQIPDDVSNTSSASGTVGDLRAAKAALEGK